MKAFTKRLFVLLTAVLMAVGLFALAACDDGKEGGKEETTYTITVTVLNPDGTPNTSAQLQYCEVIDGVEGLCYKPHKVDANGVWEATTANLNPVNVHVLDDSIPGLTWTTLSLNKDNKSGTMQLTLAE